MKKSSWFLIIVIFAVSCLEDPDCYLLNNEVIGIDFKVIGSPTSDSVFLRSIAYNNLVFFDPVEKDSAITKFFVPADRTINTFDLTVDTRGIIKRLRVGYLVQAQFVSEDCGSRYVISNLEASSDDDFVSTEQFDSVLVINPTPSRDGSGQNITIYRCPDADTLEVKLWQFSLPGEGASTARIASAPFASIDYHGTALYADQRAARLRLPVRTDATTTTYTLKFAGDLANDQKEGTLALNYEVIRATPYDACGEIVTVDNIEIVENATTLDSISYELNTDQTRKDRLTDPIITNLNVYRCPPTNLVQLAFVTEATEDVRAVSITSITDDYSGHTHYANVERDRVVLPLNPSASSTTFNINFTDRTETVTFNYSFSAPRAGLFPTNSACLQRQVITNLTVSPSENATLENAAVLYPAIVNAYVEVPN